MIVKCTNCDASYSVDDAKVAGKKFGFNCPNCHTEVVIDNRSADTQHARPEQTIEGDRDKEAAAFSEGMMNSSLEDEFAGMPDVMEEEDISAAGDLDTDLGAEMPDIEDQFGQEEVSSPLGELESGLEDIDLPSMEEEPAEEEGMPSLDELAGGLEEDMLSSIEETSAAEEETLSLDEFDSGLEDIDLPSMEEEPAEEEGMPSLDELAGGLEEDILSPIEEMSAAEEEPIVLDALEDDLEDIDLSMIGEGQGEETLPSFDEPDVGLAEEELTGETDFGDEFAIDIEGNQEELPQEDFLEMAGETAIPPTAGAEEEEEDESITIDLESLDLQLEDTEPETLREEEEEDENITLDLDSLDLSLKESDEIKTGESIDEDELRLSLQDAGLSLSEIGPEETQEEHTFQPGAEDEDELRLSIEEINPDLDIEHIAQEEQRKEPSIEEESALPDVDLAGLNEEAAFHEEDSFLDIEEEETVETFGHISDTDEEALIGGGVLNFSVDYSLRYSRLKALLRLIGIYYITFIPHLIVLSIYNWVAGIVTMLNWLVTLFTGRVEKDFSLLQEHTLRYYLSILASASGVVEERPRFAGRKDIDYALQLDIIPPAKSSRFLTVLRMSGIGIMLLLLPHFILFSILTLGMILITLAGLLSVIVAARWPSVFFDFMVRYYRYYAQLVAYMSGLVDTYPSFRFD